MVRRLFSFACSILILLVHPAFASPQTEADYIAAHFVTADDFRAVARDMVMKAYANKLAAALSTRSVKIKDDDRFVALLPYSNSVSLFERLQKAVSNRLVQSWEPAQLESVADYLRQMPPKLAGVRADAKEDAGDTPLTIDQVQQKISDLPKHESFKNEMALTAISVMLISLMVQETSKIEVDLKAPFIADLLEVDGVFSFPNRIVRKDIIHDLRSPDP